jgi:hypothetical protein
MNQVQYVAKLFSDAKIILALNNKVVILEIANTHLKQITKPLYESILFV